MIKAIKYCFPDAGFIPWYYHFIQKYLPEIKFTNEDKKTITQDLLAISKFYILKIYHNLILFLKKLKVSIILFTMNLIVI